MKISQSWIKEFVDLKVNSTDLAEKLRSLGFEIADLQQTTSDAIFDIEITPNRGDCLSTIGIAREICAAYKLELKIPKVKFEESSEKTSGSLKVEITDPLLCPRYTARIIKGVKIGQSPDWMINRLEMLGVRSVNNVVDATNYVLLETGQPMHAFDLSLIKDAKIVVRKAIEGEKITTLDGVERKLGKEMLVIADSARAIALAGVMGGANSEVRPTTKDIVIESACFNASNIRRTSQVLGLSTDASYRFERSSDIEEARASLDRVCSLIQETAGGTILKDAVDIYPKKRKKKKITLRAARLEKILGTKIAQKDILAILKKLGFTVNAAKSSLSIEVPSWRDADVTREIDIIEEVARVHGYENIDAGLAQNDFQDEAKYADVGSGLLEIQDRVKQVLASAGFFECINYGFLKKGIFERSFCVNSALVNIANPLDEEMDKLRPSLIPWLTENLSFNFNRDAECCRFFEIGHVFTGKNNEKLPCEEIMVSSVMAGTIKNFWSDKKRNIDFYDAKGAIEHLLEKLNIQNLVSYKTCKENVLCDQGLDIYIKEEKVGTIGRLKDEIAKQYKFSNEVFFFEASLEKLKKFSRKTISYVPVSKFPVVRRDAALIVPTSISMDEVMGFIKKNSNDLLLNVSLFDCYEGGQVPKGYRSLAFNFVYQSSQRTLTDQEVNDMHFGIIQKLAEKDIKLRA